MNCRDKETSLLYARVILSLMIGQECIRLEISEVGPESAFTLLVIGYWLFVIRY